ncbi:LysR family transcriptional regulator [Noviherbaspirillum galbum]|uniref:LysR family transcriptional regulator n=1 Tax=Noviherbaspirillum galbum TaxID=2709383 RepID=A0A6B3SMQ2_9BURK|nr:LysR family transcriptional regulator [Noviherbaspirillum galbum]NEX62130.1 LysR family transcriptional regulator [Noviherbaspirillum galbum]
MDKFRAAEYFIMAAREGSLSRAARQLEVSVPAVSKLISALERELGTTLFERRAQGLALTSQGTQYLEACEQALGKMIDAEQALHGSGARVHGTLTVGAPAQVCQHWILPALPAFHHRYPGLHIDLHCTNRVAEAQGRPIDLFVLMGWHEEPDMVRQPLGASRMLVCASPDYWSRHGMPRRPEDLATHTCLLFRNPMGTLLDLWEFENGNDKVAVAVTGWLCSNHRDVVLDAAISGEGVIRLAEVTSRSVLQSGRLVPVLPEWHVTGNPPMQVLYAPSQRGVTRVRVFIDFLVNLLEDTSDREFSQRPSWYVPRRTRASGPGRA